MKSIDKDLNKKRKYIAKYFAQKPSCYDRNKLLDINSSELGENYELRDEFTRDKDRIIHTKAFRRLQHKAQVYSHEKSDHYRTRLTHTIEVNQIARAIARNLNVNENLTEAIALGHDIGHTPFGHAGEEVLDDIMRGNDNLGGKLKYNLNYGGFKHNFNSLKILEFVENKYEHENGLNLTWQVLDGICKHTSIMKKDKLWDWKRFINDESFFKDLIGYEYPNENPISDFKIGVPLTVEGQIVCIADEIAQREHDLDDSAKNQKNPFDNIKLIMDATIKDIDKTMSGYNLFKELENKMMLDEIPFINSEEYFNMDEGLKWDYCIKCIFSYFIRDVTENSLNNLYLSDRNEVIFEKMYNNHKRMYIKENLINFSEVGCLFNDKIEKFVENKIINSYEVNRFDGKAKYILRQLFKAYYENPKQMPQSQLKILDNLLEKHFKEYYNSKDNLKIKFVTQPFDNVLNKDIESLVDKLKLNNKEFSDLIKKNNTSQYLNYIINNPSEHKELNYYLENHYNYLYVISNYISKMTDNYAEMEFKKLYLGN